MIKIDHLVKRAEFRDLPGARAADLHGEGRATQSEMPRAFR